MAKDSSILFTCTSQFKNALGEYAQENKVSMSFVILKAVAAVIEYDLTNEDTQDGRKKFGSKEERLAAQKKHRQSQANELKKLVEIFGTEQRRRDAGILEESLRKKGVL